MRFRVIGALGALMLTVSTAAFGDVIEGVLGEIAVFHSNVGWIGQAAADEAAAEVVANTSSTSISVVDMDGAAAFLSDNTSDGEVDVFFTFGYLPETVYEPGNSQEDGSLIEDFIEGGNIYLNTADYIFYVTLGGGANGENGLKTVTDSNFDMWTDGNVTSPTGDGAKYLPSLGEFTSNRSLKRDQVEADENWEYVAVFGEGDGGTDPAIIQNVNDMGMVGIVMQVSDDSLPRGAVITELFNNWLPVISDVDAKGKSAVAWGELKAQR